MHGIKFITFDEYNDLIICSNFFYSHHILMSMHKFEYYCTYKTGATNMIKIMVLIRLCFLSVFLPAILAKNVAMLNKKRVK